MQKESVHAVRTVSRLNFGRLTRDRPSRILGYSHPSLLESAASSLAPGWLTWNLLWLLRHTRRELC